MAELKGIFRFQGSIDQFTVYEINGKTVVRRKAHIPKEKILKSPSYQRRRETMAEFGASSEVAKALRLSWVMVRKKFQGPYISGRLSGILKSKVCPAGAGNLGQREISLLNCPQILVGFPFHKDRPFSKIFAYPLTLTPNGSRTAVTLTLPETSFGATPEAASPAIQAPAGATHYRILLLVSTLSSYQYHPDYKGYQPTNPGQSGKYALVQTPWIPLREPVSDPTHLEATLSGFALLAPEVALLACTGIEFASNSGPDLVPLPESQAMEIAAIF
ncbi:MAG: hypothetical protein H6581_26670 [Bacteroidia bacterium]|nr:hypothetical protein [Bacteroidia bacterium]